MEGIFSETQGPEDWQDRSQPRQRPCFGIGLLTARQPVSYAGQRLAGKRKGQLGKIQTTRPAAEGGGIGHAITVFEIRQGLFPRAMLHKAPPQCLTARQQAVMRVGKRKQREEGEGLPATRAATATDCNPVVMLIVRLLAAASVANNRIPFTSGTLRQDDLVAVSGPVGLELA